MVVTNKRTQRAPTENVLGLQLSFRESGGGGVNSEYPARYREDVVKVKYLRVSTDCDFLSDLLIGDSAGIERIPLIIKEHSVLSADDENKILNVYTRSKPRGCKGVGQLPILLGHGIYLG